MRRTGGSPDRLPCTAGRRPGRGPASSCRSRPARRAGQRPAPRRGSSPRWRRARRDGPGSVPRPSAECGQDAGLAVVRRVVRRLGALGLRGLRARGSVRGLPSAASSPAAAVFRVVRRLGAAVAPASSAVAARLAGRPALRAPHPRPRHRRSTSPAPPSRSPCAWSDASAPASRRRRPSRPRRPRRSGRRSVPACRTLVSAGGAVGRCPTWARSIASSSGGTSLHGSAEPDGRAASRGR